MTTVDSSTRAYETVDGLSVELADSVLTITMNRPDSLNSLTHPMLACIADSVEREKQGQSVLITSDDFKEGMRAFQQRRSPTFVRADSASRPGVGQGYG